jgi:hypothetical protein
LGDLFGDYVTDGQLFLCPTADKATELAFHKYTPDMAPDLYTDYVYVSGLIAADPPDHVLMFDDEWNHDGDGVHVAFIGGRVQWMGAEELHGLLAKQERVVAARGREMKLLRPAWSAWPDSPTSGHPLAGERPWYRRRNANAALFGTSVAFVTALVMAVVALVRRKRAVPDDAA